MSATLFALTNSDVQPFIWGIGLVVAALVGFVTYRLSRDNDPGISTGIAVAICLVVVLIAAGIGWMFTAGPWSEAYRTARGKGDSDVTNIDQSPAFTLEMPDEFSSIATKCVWDGWRAFTTSNDGGMAVVPDDECEMPQFIPVEEVEQ